MIIGFNFARMLIEIKLRLVGSNNHNASNRFTGLFPLLHVSKVMSLRTNFLKHKDRNQQNQGI
jgi:cell division FtsZ-interacting protein ZapD